MDNKNAETLISSLNKRFLYYIPSFQKLKKQVVFQVNLSVHPDPNGLDLEIFSHLRGFHWEKELMVLVLILASEAVSI